MVSVDQFVAFFDSLELTYTRGVRDLPEVDCLPDNIGTIIKKT